MTFFASFFRRAPRDSDLKEELHAHIAQRADDLERAGLLRREAERRARVEFGGFEHYREESHRAARGAYSANLARDLRYSFRVLRRSPGFVFVAVSTLALAIGANAVVFSLLNTVVLRPLDVPAGKDIYQIENAINRQPQQSYPDYIDLRDRNRAFDGLALYEISTAAIDSDGKPVPAWLYTASGNYFDVLRLQPYLGRFFHASDEHGRNSAPYIVLSYAYWQSHFQGDRTVVGRTVRLNKFTYTILGVAPPGFRGTELFYAPDFWVPIVNQQQVEGSSNLDQRGSRGRWVFGRLKNGVSPTQAIADLNRVGAYLAKTYPLDDEGIAFALARPGFAGDLLGKPVHAFVAGLMLLAGLILLAACANLGGLFAARAADRMREVALRLALGATHGRILRQLLTEAVLASLAGGALGVAASVALLRALGAWRPVPNFPMSLDVHPDISTYAFALLLALASGLLFGLVPVRQVLKTDPYQGIRAGANAGMRSYRVTFRDVLLAAQIAACAVLVTSSIVAVRGMLRSLHSNFGFTPQNVLQADTDLSMAGYKGAQIAVMQRRMLDAVETLPGVTAAAYADRVPLNMGWHQNTVFEDSATDFHPSNAAAHPLEYHVSPGYLHAAGTALLQGRDFTWDDKEGAPRVAIVNQQFARMLFGSSNNAVGRFFKTWGGAERIQVVGIVEDGKYKTLSEDPQPAMFFPILQSPSGETLMLVHSNRAAPDLASGLGQTLRGLDPGLPLTIEPWDTELGTALLAARAASMALGVLGALGALLAATGIFGMAAYSVTKRLRELGIRIALGARRDAILKTALGRVARLLAIGSVVGLLLGVAATKLLSYIVYQATPRDPVVLGGVLLTMLLLGLIAAWIPAQRALGADPVALLREE